MAIQLNADLISRLTFEQQPPNIKANIAPTVSHCGIVSIKMRPKSAMTFEEVDLSLSMPNISAFSKEGAALIILGIAASPSVGVD
jgi:hypothetical protein